jgi:hypothetical protein
MKVANRHVIGIVILLVFSAVAYSQDTITKTYYSGDQWSGQGKEFNQKWYSFTTPPAPAGYAISDVKYELQGDRLCHTYGECKEVKRNADGSVVLQFRMQGHDEKFHPVITKVDKDGVTFQNEGSKATSRLGVTITYRKK